MFLGLFLGGCGISGQPKSATIEKEGVLVTKVGEEYILNSDGDMTNITSNKVYLDNYLKKNIKVTGEFSGSTLYVDKVE
ncbi:MAG: hypothetical protein NTY75_04105 [Candidatus Shapirobacteria bacterium]|nr:hypothetical protein [Candidatus Shapirobacteria bacterium]